MWVGLSLFAGALLGMAGCASRDAHLKPPKPPEQYIPPPDKDTRYTTPIQYPKDSLDKDILQQRAKEAANGPGPGMRGPGMGMGGGGY
jgi:hypothetical protein